MKILPIFIISLLLISGVSAFAFSNKNEKSECRIIFNFDENTLFLGGLGGGDIQQRISNLEKTGQPYSLILPVMCGNELKIIKFGNN